jgi:hypothetical protein
MAMRVEIGGARTLGKIASQPWSGRNWLSFCHTTAVVACLPQRDCAPADPHMVQDYLPTLALPRCKCGPCRNPWRNSCPRPQRQPFGAVDQ